jgi:alanine racemase
VRPGLSLSGIDPACRPCMERPLRPVLKWTAPLIGIRAVPAGTTVGYGQTFTANQPMRIGLLPVGYADGYLRQFSNRAVVIIQGRPAPVIGRVSMDLTTIDLTQFPQANIGDEVTLLDDDPLSPASVYKLAEWGQTIPYEILCRIGPRVRRLVVEPPEPAAPWRAPAAKARED